MPQLLKFRFFVFLFLLCLVDTVSFGQVLTHNDSIQLSALYKKGREEQNPKIALKYYDSIIAFSEKKHFIKGLIWANRQKAQIYSEHQQPDKALVFVNKAINIAVQNHQQKELVGILLYSSAFNNEFAHYDKAFSDATKAIAVAVKSKDTSLIGKSYAQLGRCYSAKEDYKKAIVNLEKSADFLRKVNDIESLRETLTSLAGVNIEAKNYSKALGQLKEVEKSAPEIPMNPYKLPELYGNIGFCYDSMGKYDLAVQYYLKTLELTKGFGLGMLVTEVVIKDYLGKIYLLKGKYDLAQNYLNEALEGALQVGTPDEFKTVYGHLSELAFLKKDYKKAYEYQEKHIIYADSVMTHEKMKALENLAVKYQTKEVEDQNKLLERKNALQKAYAEQEQSRKNNWLILLSAALLLLLSGGYFYYRNNKQKQAITVLEKDQIKQKLLITQMNPHFIFNSIDNIQSLIYNKQDDDAVNYLTKFSKLTRQILENSNENYISLTEEVDMIKNYLSIQQLLYNNKFDFNIAVEPTIDTETIFLPPMLTQPFIENAIKHGLSNKTADGMIEIGFYLKEAKLFFEVSDNGKGFDAGQKTDNHKSLAMTITKERLVNYTKNQDFVVQTDNKTDQDHNVIGATVFFEIPYIYEN